MKAVLVMQHGWFPPVAHLETLNPHLALEGSGLEIPVRGKQWPEDVHKFCGVSSFGWSGTNAHVVLEEAPKQQEPATAKLPVVIALSAMTTEALRQLAEAFAVQMEKADERELAAMGYTSTARRTHYRYRLAVFGSEGPKMAALLRKRAAEFSADGGVALANASGTFHAQQLDQVNPDELIAAYESGTEIDWQERYPHSGEGIALPQYPFGGRRYWLAESKTAAPSRETRTAEAQPTPTCMDPASAGEAGAETELVRGLRGLSPRDRYERLLSFLINETRAIIGLAAEEAIDEERGLIEMGMDSLMTVMLQNGLQSALGIELSSTLVLDYPSLTALAHYLDKKVFGKAEEAAPSGPAAVNALDQSDAEAESIASMSSAEMDAALAEELAAVRRLGVQ
jgi:acyl transferase domain-containing protein